ncbi:hypothetical protein [Streptomyces virginiae]|uniref:hypothetical protein n=1 Tax=Streptomyces virginiae TaxID=1961 RepID=UPI0036A0AFF6
MGNTLIALAVAVVGVAGTLIASVLSPRMLARIQAEQFERQQRAADAQWIREQRVAEVEKRRACYVTANSGYRRHRIELMKYLWLVHKAEVTASARADLEETRHSMHTAFAEAQMVASDAVLRELDAMTVTLAGAYSRTLLLADGDPQPGWSFEEIQTLLLRLGDRWKDMRGIMRADLGVDPGPADA